MGFLLKLMMLKNLIAVSVSPVFLLVALSLLLLYIYTGVFYQLYCLTARPTNYLFDRGVEYVAGGILLSLVGGSFIV